MNRPGNRGMVMLVVLVIVAISAMVAVGVMYRVGAEQKAAAAADHYDQAYAAAYSGLHKAMAVVSLHGPDPLVWQDNPDLFENQLVHDDGSEQWYFCVYSPALADDAETVRFGLTDEAGKVNVNVAGPELLAELPNLSDEQIDCLLDYVDRDDQPRPRGAEQDAYDFTIRNHPSIWTIEELLLIHHFDGPTVYGEDVNGNGLLDPNEDDGALTFPPDNSDGMLDRGLRSCATAVSYEYDVNRDGRPRVHINAPTRQLAAAGLPRQTVEFLTAWQKAKQPPLESPAQLWGLTLETTERRGRREVRVLLESGIDADNLHLAVDGLTARRQGGRMVRGRINVNTAGLDVLAALCRSVGIDEQLAERIVETRGQVPVEDLATPAWLASSGLIQQPETMQKLAPHLTARSGQFRLYSVGFSVPSGRYCVLEAIIDQAGKTPRIAYLRDVTRLGLPLGLEVEEIQY